MYNLQEAYLGVYYDLDEELTGDRARKAVKKDAELMHRIQAKDKTPGLRQKRALIHRLLRPSEDRTSYGRGNKALRRMGYTPTEGGTFFNPFNEQLDLYDLIFDYLLDEGYADTEEAATVIMANMSEDWVQSIVESEEEKTEQEKPFTGEGPKKPKGWKPKGPKRSYGQRPPSWDVGR